MAAAIGLGLPIHDPVGSVIVDVGAGTSEAAVISLGGIVALKALRVGGRDLDEAIADMVRHSYDLVISERSSEQLKVGIGSAGPATTSHTAEVHGRRTSTGEPASVLLGSDVVSAAIADVLRSIVEGVKQCLADSPPEFAQDAIFEGIQLVGGGAQLNGFAELLAEGTSIPVHVAHNPTGVVIEGAGRCLDDLDRLRPLFEAADH